ncbi:MAG: cysteine desulfurase/selenocysteine lyase [Alteromonadaceae bacterium]|jgi:cysteine desulfurase/selenocysteine lyase
MNSFDNTNFRALFPILKTQVNQQALIYFDNGATTQKPHCVIDKYQQFYSQQNANVHRASHALSTLATQSFEQSREKVKNFIHAHSIKEIIWTSGTTESINIIAQSWGRNNLKAGDEIVLSQCEHHANIVPWQMVAEQTGAIIKVLPLTAQGLIDISAINATITSKVKIVCCAHISNVLGRINPIEKIIARAKKMNAVSVIDGAQAIAHQGVNVTELGCDFYVFSAHKMYGPTGVGVLYGRAALLNVMPPYQGGGEMIKTVSFEQTTYNELPFKFEAGTPNIAGIIAFSAAIDFLQQHSQNIEDYEKKLLAYCMEKLLTIPQIQMIVAGVPDIPLISFIIKEHHNHDIAASLDAYGIAVRSGHHCAMPLMAYLNLSGCLRISLAGYNTFAEIDTLLNCLHKIINQDSSPQVVKKNNHQVTQASQGIIDLFEKAKGWDGKHREIMLLGKNLHRLGKEKRDQQSLISGCESQAWLVVEKNNQGLYHFTGDSDAKVIRGLLVIVLAAFNDKTAVDINSFDITHYFEKLGLIQHLSPSRGSGVLAIVDKIRQIAY